MTGHVCPVCGRQDGTGGGSGGVGNCRCGQGATAEGFDPLRVRPYVALPDAAGAPDATAAGPPPELTQELPQELTQVLPPTADGAAGRDAAAGQEGAASRDGVPGQPPGGAGRPPGGAGRPPGGAGHAGTYAYGHLHGHDTAYDMTGAEPDPAPAGLRRGRGRSGRHMAVAAAAVVAVLLTAAYATGLLTKDGGGDDRALPDSETTAPFVSAAPEAPEAPLSTSPSRTRSASPSASTSPPEPASASAPAATGSSSPVPLAAGPASPPEAPTPTGVASPGPSSADPGATLRRGDNGPEVAELQERLEQAGFYGGRHHGRYDRRVEDAVAAYQYYSGIQGDPEGVYGPATRSALEAETRYPGDDHGQGDGGGDWDGDGRR
ncbi:peptidoglycan-binding protein [Streptomyces sp. PKU-MA01144]|uniref:peptidoglycan-binding domain-containing protein n=1 Tax=Streptomyces sp. PKU-MA01144 TaxID=2729138 RepID=UPI0020180D67|nr:peptidoglycan-binding domain-containing protein [Streptomyces sp. PKU-MA01144]